jgi:hypothetical protein
MTPVMQVAYPRRKNGTDRQADMDRPTRCSSLTLELKEHLITRLNMSFKL